jgi:hypothetical protein
MKQNLREFVFLISLLVVFFEALAKIAKNINFENPTHFCHLFEMKHYKNGVAVIQGENCATRLQLAVALAFGPLFSLKSLPYQHRMHLSSAHGREGESHF